MRHSRRVFDCGRGARLSGPPRQSTQGQNSSARFESCSPGENHGDTPDASAAVRSELALSF